MGDDDECRSPRPRQGQERAQNLGGRLLVEIAGRLVGEQNGGLVHQCARNGHPLLLATRQPVDGAVQAIAEPYLREHRGTAAAGSGPPNAVQLEGEADVFLCVERGQEVEKLVHEPEARPPEERSLRLRHGGDDPVADRHLAAVRAVDAAHEIEQSRLPGAAAADDRDQLAGGDASIGPVEHPVHTGSLAEAAAELADDDQGGPEKATNAGTPIYNRSMKHVVARTPTGSAAACAAAALLGLSSLALAQGAPGPAQPQEKPQSPAQIKSEGSYSLGLSMGETLRRAAVDANAISTQRVLQGMHDALSGKATFGPANEASIRTLIMSSRTRLGNANHAAARAFLARNGKKKGVVTTASGLEYQVVQAGHGNNPKADDVVTVNYRGTLLNGTEFDSSYKRGQPASFPVDRVIPGWQEALKLMKPGAKWRLFVPPQLAYDLSSPPPIPPGSLLIFDVNLIGVQPPQPAPKMPSAPPPSGASTQPHP